MIVEDERELPTEEQCEFNDFEGQIVTPEFSITVEDSMVDAALSPFVNMLERMKDNHNVEIHTRLQKDLKVYFFWNFPHYKDRDGL